MKNRRIHLDVFKMFCDLAETRSFSETATRHFLTRSAISQQISSLERTLSVRLLHRGRRRFSLTEEGRIFLEGSRRILDGYQDLLESLHRRQGEPSGTLKIGTIYSIGLHQLGPYVRSFMRKHRHIQLNVEYKRAGQIYADTLSGACDLGIVAYAWRQPSISVTPFKKEKLVVICAPEHRFAPRKRISIKELHQQPFIAFQRGIPTRAGIDAILRRHRANPLVVHEFDNIETLKRCVEVGAGVSILPETTILREVVTGMIARLEVEEGPFFRPLGIIRSEPRAHSQAEQAFVRWLRKN